MQTAMVFLTLNVFNRFLMRNPRRLTLIDLVNQRNKVLLPLMVVSFLLMQLEMLLRLRME